MTRPFPDAQPHGALRELFDDVFFVSGGIRMSGPVPMRFSRNMTVVRQGESLTLINSMRLSEAGLVELDALGKVEHVIRIAAFHGSDDPFYKDRYGAKVWAVEGSGYHPGFDAAKPASEGYFQPDEWMTADSELPIAGASLFRFGTSNPAEGMLLLAAQGGILVSGDCLQNWATADEFFNLPARVVMRLMGFLKPLNLGPGWIKGAKPASSEVKRLLDLRFEHVLPAHGAEVIGGARDKYRPVIDGLR